MDSLGGLSENKHAVILGTIYLLSFLMVSTIDYLGFKELELFKQKPFNVLVATVLLFVVVAYKPPLMLFLFSTMYIISGPAITVYQRSRRHAKAAIPTGDSAPAKRERSLESEL